MKIGAQLQPRAAVAGVSHTGMGSVVGKVEGWRVRGCHRVSGVLVAVGLIVCAACAGAQQIAITFDDLPAHGPLPVGTSRLQIARQVTDALRAAHVPPTYGFINGGQGAYEPATDDVLRLWVRSGNLLGNHTWSHMNLNDHTAAEFEEDIARNEPLLQKLQPEADWHWLRFPFLAEGDTAEKRNQVRAYLAEHHYRIAGMSLGFPDYDWAAPYARCAAAGDAHGIAELEANYLDAAKVALQYSRAVAHARFDHDVPYVLLLHIGALDARMLPQLLAMYGGMGAEFISLQRAQSDPSYAADMNLTAKPPSPQQDKGASSAGPKIVAPVYKTFDNLCR